jgi:hypothetical protein
VRADEAVWTVEDRREVRIVLPKALRGADRAWRTLMADGRFAADASQWDHVEKKAALERMQRENPGFDFSGADITGNYHGGGPSWPGR